MKNYYQDFDDIMTYYQEALKYALDNADYFANKKSTQNIVRSLHL